MPRDRRPRVCVIEKPANINKEPGQQRLLRAGVHASLARARQRRVAARGRARNFEIDRRGAPIPKRAPRSVSCVNRSSHRSDTPDARLCANGQALRGRTRRDWRKPTARSRLPHALRGRAFKRSLGRRLSSKTGGRRSGSRCSATNFWAAGAFSRRAWRTPGERGRVRFL